MIDFFVAYNKFIDSKHKENLAEGLTNHKKFKESCKYGKREIHHIVPQCFGGKTVIDNLVSLTPQEHIYAHFILNFALIQHKSLQDVKRHNFNRYLTNENGFNDLTNVLDKNKIKIIIVNAQTKCETVLNWKEALKFFMILRGNNIDNINTAVFDLCRMLLIAGMNINYFGLTWKTNIEQMSVSKMTNFV